MLFDFSLLPWLCFCSKVTLRLPDSLNTLLIFLTPPFEERRPLTPQHRTKAPLVPVCRAHTLAGFTPASGELSEATGGRKTVLLKVVGILGHIQACPLLSFPMYH